MQIAISSNAQAVLAQVRGAPARMLEKVRGAMDKENNLTVGYIQRTQLSGPRPVKLGVDTDRLRLSLRATAARIDGNAVESSIGSNVAYAGVHEYGFEGTVTVRAHKRNVFRTHQSAGGSVFDSRTGRVRKQSPRAVTLLQGQASVRSFTRKMKVPQRAYIQTGLADSQLNYSIAISHAIESAWPGGTN